MSVSINQRQKVVIEMESKSEIENILSYGEIPEDELHVLEGSQISKLLKAIKGNVSFSLVAKADRRYGVPNYTIGYSENLKIIEVKTQKTPLVAKNYGIIREREKEGYFQSFRDNGLYLSYYIEIESPSREIWDKLRSQRKLAPWALPDSPYDDK